MWGQKDGADVIDKGDSKQAPRPLLRPKGIDHGASENVQNRRIKMGKLRAICISETRGPEKTEVPEAEIK